ncbi:YbhB/YbcL family Raf kinase inhibitor-like protein [Anaeromyxobacter paludicola]|uniref:YbhB/YbcL family Raf kinase inhibitor-like protein n=1 Tax=Anaeromyxobacter paludicola TaxID=2918171 RepID=A0ABN6N9S5_9BACT|nr:YbhB/YbcL family Raf kinase inhibitor-like protein [Anaeromyxobacter paludicola]BDG08760.1 hypothetical protein AMPC_18730 [Anaeromyxobacter paludicola]
MPLTLSSPAFAAGAEIPAVHTCEGKHHSPPLAWSGAPRGTQSFALVADDPDAPDPAAPQRVFVHWVLYNLPATASALAEGAPQPPLPEGARQGKNDALRPGYTGPCPPIGRHRYFFKLYALDAVLPDLGAPTKAELLAALAGHVLAQAELMGTYRKHR